ncbi:MAG: mechanosensitive ion channel family protein, partial [Alphaproteobacteria bacterium]
MIWDELAANPSLQAAIGVGLLVAVALLVDWLTKAVVVRSVRRALKILPNEEIHRSLSSAVGRFAHIIPAFVFYLGVAWVPTLPDLAATVLSNVAAALIIFAVIFAVSGALNLVNDLYQRRPGANARPIKGYIQVLKMLLYGVGIVLVIATVVLMLVFKDTILSLVASVQLTSNDMVRVGDWIEMPALNADGDVIDIALHTVKVQNWDKTITTIPTYRLISDSFRNWRGMRNSGGRRIKRALNIDLTSIRFLDPEERDSLRRIALIDEYLDKKKQDIEKWNAELIEGGKDPVNARQVTNLGTFRAYA